MKIVSYVKRGMRHLHRIVAEQKLGRPLRSGEIVHHMDGNQQNNAPENLQVMTQSEHARLHQQGTKRAPKMVCKNGHALTPDNVRITSIGRRSCLTCSRMYSANWHKQRRSARGLQRPGPKPGSVRHTRNENGTFAKESP